MLLLPQYINNISINDDNVTQFSTVTMKLLRKQLVKTHPQYGLLR